MGFTKVELATEGRTASFAVRAGPSMPTKSRISHETIMNIQNDGSHSSKEMVQLMKHLRGDVDVQPHADKMLVETNHTVDKFFRLSLKEMEIKKEEKEKEEKEDEENDEVK